jgi:hypothetical protein
MPSDAATATVFRVASIAMLICGTDVSQVVPSMNQANTASFHRRVVSSEKPKPQARVARMKYKP